MKRGDLALDGAIPVRLLGAPRYVAGGRVVDVERAEDSTDPAARLSDGSLHPAHRAGFRWTAVVGNLRPIADVAATRAAHGGSSC